MKLADYIKTSERTLTPRPAEDNIIHAALGIITELAELEKCETKINAVEEVGDVMFYAAILFRAQGATDFTNLKANSAVTLAARLTGFQAAAQIADAAKRHKFYGTAMHWPSVNFALLCIEAHLTDILRQAGATMADALAANDAKLRARYPDGWTQKAAVERDLNKEEKSLADAIAAGGLPEGVEQQPKLPLTTPVAKTQENKPQENKPVPPIAKVGSPETMPDTASDADIKRALGSKPLPAATQRIRMIGPGGVISVAAMKDATGSTSRQP